MDSKTTSDLTFVNIRISLYSWMLSHISSFLVSLYFSRDLAALAAQHSAALQKCMQWTLAHLVAPESLHSADACCGNYCAFLVV